MDFDRLAEKIIGRVAKHARHTSTCNILQSAKQIAFVFAEILYEREGNQNNYKGLSDAIAAVCPEEKISQELIKPKYT